MDGRYSPYVLNDLREVPRAADDCTDDRQRVKAIPWQTGRRECFAMPVSREALHWKPNGIREYALASSSSDGSDDGDFVLSLAADTPCRLAIDDHNCQC